MRNALVAGLALALALPAAGVTLTIGNAGIVPDASDGNIGPVRTDIDLNHPASHSGTVTVAQIYWSSAGCTNAFKIKFFRRLGDTLQMTAERGPFTPSGNNYSAALSPPVSVQQGDLIGVARIASCGNPGAALHLGGEGFLQYPGDVAGPVDIGDATAKQAGTLALSALGTVTEWMARTVTVVGSAPGGFGSFFKTEMQFFNPQSTGSTTCKLVFHPAGAPGSNSDNARLVILDPGEVFSTADVVAAMGQSGIGSIDLWVPAGQNVPIVLARVYNDAGPLGTSGLTEPPVPTADPAVGSMLLGQGSIAYLVAPRDPAKTRFNIGYRSLHSGAVIDVTVRDKAGVTLKTLQLRVVATYFRQDQASQLLGVTLKGDETIELSVASGSAIVYGSTTDNVTNDPAIQFAIAVAINR